jgi:sec-independent protein translocase protein TatB
MFDIGFWELSVIMVVALLVVGPERLPGLARKAGMWAGRARRFVSSVKQDIDRELAAEELKRIMAEQADSKPLHDIVESAKAPLEEAKRSLEEAEQALKDDQPPPPADSSDKPSS